MAAFIDGCRFNPAAGGTADWTYVSAVTGYQSPAAANVANGRLYKYRAESTDLSQWEFGEGAYNTTTGVLARTTILYNSSGTTAKISFSTVPQVAIVALAEDLISVEVANSFTTAQKAQACANIGAQAAITSGTIFLASNLSLTTATTWLDVVSVALAAGTYWISAKAAYKNGTQAGIGAIRLVDSTAAVFYDTSSLVYTTGAGARVQLVMSGVVVTLAAPVTLKIQAQDFSGTTAGIITANESSQASARDTSLSWMKIA
jgi:hypothetical protein